MTAPEELPAEPVSLPVEVRALIIKAFIGEAQKELDGLTKELGEAFPRAGTTPFESPLDGASLGHINRAKTSREWKVTALPQVVEYFTTHHPAVLETVYLLAVPGIDAPVALPEEHPITQALLESAPDLLTPERRVPPEVVQAAVQDSEEKGVAAAPGIQLVRGKQGALSVVYDKTEAIPAIRRLVATGLISWDGRPALPAADEREAS